MTIGVKDEQKGDDKVPVRAIVDKERQIDLLKLHKYCGSIGANENWSSIAQKMNFLLTAQKAVDLGIDPKAGTAMIVTLENNQEKVSIPEALEADLTKAMNVVAELEALSPQTEVDITLVDDAAIHELNRTYRGIDRPTDVLSFALDEGEEEPEVDDDEIEHLLGDVIISAPTAVRQGEEYGHGLEREMTYLAVHGMLHLLGYDHMEEKDKLIMRKREEEVLRRLDLAEENFGG